jgi:hypothetical protein
MSRENMLRELGDVQADCAARAKRYVAEGKPDLAKRFQRAALYGSNARTFIQAAYMAAHEAGES